MRTDERKRRATLPARAHVQPTAYDLTYVATAQLGACWLWTADRRLVRAVAGTLPWGCWIGEDDATAAGSVP